MTAVMMTPVIPVTILTVTIIMIIMIHRLPMTLAIRAGNRRKTVWNSRKSPDWVLSSFSKKINYQVDMRNPLDLGQFIK